jgi:transcriptional regulator with XRE-family HTH domain
VLVELEEEMTKRGERGYALRRILAENMRTIRYQKELSQEKLAEISGLHRTYVGSVERAERNVTLSTLEALATALGVSVPELLTKGEARSEQE